MPRLSKTAASLAFALLALPIVDVTLGEQAAWADEAEAQIQVGTELVATSDVSLSRASLVRGSRVFVTKLITQGRRVAGFKVALADGHVVKVALSTVQRFFRVADSQ